MMSFSVWLPDPMFLLEEVSVPGPMFPSGGICPWGGGLSKVFTLNQNPSGMLSCYNTVFAFSKFLLNIGLSQTLSMYKQQNCRCGLHRDIVTSDTNKVFFTFTIMVLFPRPSCNFPDAVYSEIIIIVTSDTYHVFYIHVVVLFARSVCNFYRSQTKLPKGNVLTSVCQEFCP